MEEKTSQATIPDAQKKLGTIALTALVIGAIVGGGIFSLPQNMTENAGAAAIIIAWVITFIGMFSLAKVFVWLSLNRPDIDDSLYGYARLGFGQYMGFNSAWGYWISILIGCGTGYMVIFFNILGSFEIFSFFGEGNTLIAMICQIILVWAMHIFVLRGVQNAAIVNTIVTIAKILPILLFLVFASLAFKIETFSLDFWGKEDLGSLLDQVRSTMLFTLWVFLGMECAAIYSTRAQSTKAISHATTYGFILTFILMAGVSLLSLGVVPRAELALMENPSMIGVMERATGAWGAMVVRIGVLIALGGALLAWILICSEMLYLSGRGKNHTSPKIFGHLNKYGAPSKALLLTNVLITLLVIYNYFSSSGYNKLIQLGSTMSLIPYWLAAAFAFKLFWKMPYSRNNMLIIIYTTLATIFSTWLIYAGGLKFLLLSMVFYAPGIILYMWACKEKKEPFFPDLISKISAVIIVGLGIVSYYLIFSGRLML